MKRRLISLISLFVVLFAVLAPVTYAFDPFGDVCEGASDATVCTEKEEPQDITSNRIYGRDGVFTKAVNIISIAIGIAAIVMVFIGSFKFIMSGGDANQAASARRTVTFAIVGVVVALFAQVIILFVLNKL